MDRLIDLASMPMHRLEISSFNPCCDGSAHRLGGRPSGSTVDACFNPCCDGTDSSTVGCRSWPSDPAVSILVVMDTDSSTVLPIAMSTGHEVSILVVMERTHRLARRVDRWRSRCFNPCCDGTDSSTSRVDVSFSRTSFNPCCDGYGLIDRRHGDDAFPLAGFQSLL